MFVNSKFCQSVITDFLNYMHRHNGESAICDYIKINLGSGHQERVKNITSAASSLDAVFSTEQRHFGDGEWGVI